MATTATKILVIDIGGTNVKMLMNGKRKRLSFPSGPKMTPEEMVAGVRKATEDWRYDAVSIGYPGPVLRGRPVAEPHNLAAGWVGFDYAAAFPCPVKLLNDAAMQALGNYRSGRMLFLGLGTGLGSAMINANVLEPMELGHLPYKKGVYEDYLGNRGLERAGKRKWRAHVLHVVTRLAAALAPDEIVLGGGNARLLKDIPAEWRIGANSKAFVGGFRLWRHPGPGDHIPVLGRLRQTRRPRQPPRRHRS